MIINILRQYGFNFSKIPTDLQEAISVLSQKTNGLYDSDNEKLKLLDETVFNSIKKLFPDDESVILTNNIVELIDSSIVNNGFNTILKEDIYNDNTNTIQQIYAKNGLALNEEDMENNGGMPGGMLVGNSHANGGIKIQTPEGQIEAEGGEVIVNKRVLALDEQFECTGTPKDITSKINEMEGGVSWSDKGSCRIVKKAANGIDIESDVEINRAEEGIAVQYSENGKLFIVEADTEEQAELIEDAINDYREGFIEKEELENTLQSYMNDELSIDPSSIEVIGGIKHVKSDFYQGWIPLRNQEPIQLDNKAEHGTALKNGKVSFENIGNGTWAFEYNDNGIKANGIVKKNEKIGEFDYVIEDTYETFDKDNREISSGIYREVGSAFSNSENRFMKSHKKAAWGWNILGAMGEKSHAKDDSSEVNAKLIDLDAKWEALRDEYRYGGFTTEEYFENKKELLAEYEPYIARALQLGIAVNQGILWGVKKAERGTEVNPVQPKPADVRPGMYKVFSLTNADYPEWTGDVYDIKRYIKESSDFNEEDWEDSLYKLGLTYSELPIEAPVMAANGYFRTQDKEKRPSPSISAKIYPAGYRMEGNDGNIWEISVATNGVHRWVRSHKSIAADGVEINRVEEVAKYISIGFDSPSGYKPSAWAKAKRYMDQLVELGYITKDDRGRGKGKYWTNDKSDALSTNLSELCDKLAEKLIDSGKIKAEDGIDLFPDKDGKVTIIEAYDTNEKGDDKEQLWLYLGQPNAQFKVVYTVTDMDYVKEDVLSEKGTAFVAEKLEDVVFTDEDGNEAKFGLDEEISAMEDITALFKKYIEGQTWEDKPSSVKIADDEILKAANGVIISSSCGCQHKAANGAKIQDSDFYDKEFAKELELKYGKNTRFKAVATNEELEKLYGRKLADSEIKGKFSAPYKKYDNGGGIVLNENDDMELWFSPGGQHMMPKPKGTALHLFEGLLTQKIGAKQLELTESNDHEYVYQIIGNMDRINQKISELKGFEVETYGMQKRVHIPIEIINQVVLSIRYPLMTPYAEGGPVKDWTDNLGVTNEDMKWIDQIEKEHIEEDIIWLFYENYRSAEEAENAKSKADIKKYDTKVVEHNGKYWLFFKMNFGLEAFERVAAADGIMVDEEVENEERTEEFTRDEDIEKHGTVSVSEWNKYNDLYKDKIKYAEYEIPESVAVFEGKKQYSSKFFKMYGTVDHIKKAFDFIEFHNKLTKDLADEKDEYPELARPKDLKVYALNRASYVDGYKAYANGGTIGAEHEAWVDQHLTDYGFDVNELTPEQKSLILQPTEAPEVYSQDGEIRSGEAMSIWLKKLAQILKGADIKKAVRANFAADGKSITVYDEVRPTGEFLSSQILRSAVRIGAITIEQANSNSNIRSVAREVANDHRDDEEIGSSDMTFILKEFLDGIGLETYFGGNSGSSLQFKGDVKMKNGGFINREDFYQWNKPKERTKNRLTEMYDLGMTEVGVAQFGIKDVMSGLYIEMVWSYTDEEFKSYMDWVKSLIKEKGWVKPEEAANGAFVKMGDGQSIPLKLLNQISKELYNEGSYYTLDKHDHNAGTFVIKEARARIEAGAIFNEAKGKFPNTLKNLGDNYTVSLSAEPNPDYDEDTQEGSVNIPEQLVPVKSVSEARNKVMQFISENDLGSGNWSGGQIFENGKPIAFVSYNGRVWEGKIEDGSNKEFKH